MDRETKYFFSRKVLLEPIFWIFLLVLMGYMNLKWVFPFGVLLIPFGLLILLYFLPNSLRKVSLFLRNTPAIVVNMEGIIDNINNQEYLWSDIYDISYHKYRKAIGICIGEINTAKYIEQTSWFLPKRILKFELKISHGTFYISKQYIDPDRSLLDKLIEIQTIKE